MNKRIKADGNDWVVAVPDILLQHPEPVTVHICERTPGGITTQYTQAFPVIARPKPIDYVYTYEEIKTWDALAGQLQKLTTTLNLVAGRVTTLEKLPAKLTDLQTAVDDLEKAATGYVKEVNGMTPGEDGAVSIKAGDIGAQAASWASSWDIAVQQLGTSNLVHAGYGSDDCPIPSDCFPVLLLRGIISRGIAPLTAFTATGDAWNGSIDLTTGVATLEQYGAETSNTET